MLGQQSSMNTSDFDYSLPPEYIAQTPLEPRDSSRLMVLDRQSGQITHTVFRQIGQFLHTGDLLVVNETRVIPARLYAHKTDSGGRVELLLLKQVDPLTWEALAGGKGLYTGRRLHLESPADNISAPDAEVVEVLEGPRRLVRFSEPLEPYLARIGHMPLPPYIHTALADPERYQTVYATQPGSAAAPTAGLHFTPDLMESLKAQGVRFANVTLHVGLDTFAPVTEDDPLEHKIHTEWCQVSPETAQAINQTKQNGARVVAVGTTSVRSLESAVAQALKGQTVASFTGNTALFIYPGYRFRAVDAIVTNFHLPRSTLIMLVSAFAGRERILDAYETAKREGYRFYSFGDAMLIL
jgi:S-adenosylmethionine:tRNA ribosyltransferase-isomerase